MVDLNKFCIVGCGTIGFGWSVVFAKAGHQVVVYDQSHQQLDAFQSNLKGRLEALANIGIIEDVGTVINRIDCCSDFGQAVNSADYIQECIPENAELKRDLFKSLEAAAPQHAIFASSTSSITPAEFLDDLGTAERCIIAHPFNPAYLLPLVELLPARATRKDVLTSVRELMTEIGMSPVTLHRAVPGFVANRLQAAVVSEAIGLVQQGVINATDVDLCMRDGLGLRWAFMGPLQTMDLNAPGGFRDYTSKFADSYQALSKELLVAESWEEHTLSQIDDELREDSPLSFHEDKIQLRDKALFKLRELKNDLEI